MHDTSALERYLNADASTQSQAIEDLQTNAACGLCALASLLENQREPVTPETLAEVGQLIRELSTMGAVTIVAAPIRH